MFGIDKKKRDEIKTAVEVKANSDVDFATKEKWVDPITKMRINRQAKKEEDARRRKEQEEKEKREKTFALIMLICIMGFSLFMANHSKSDNIENTSNQIVNEENQTNKSKDIIADDFEQDNDIEIDSDKIFDASDIPLQSTETVDLGYITIRARAWNHFLDEHWSFSLLDCDGSVSLWFDIETITDDQVEILNKSTFKWVSSASAEERNYIFTMKGYGTWTPSSNDDEADDGSFSFVLDRVLNIEKSHYDTNSDDALIYN